MADSVVRRDVVEIGFDVSDDPLVALVQELRELKSALAGIKTDGLNEVAEGAKKSAAATSKLQRDIDKANAVITKMKSGFNAVAHPIQTIKNGFGNVASKIKTFTTTLTQGEKGAKGLGNAVKNLGKVSVVRLTSGLTKIAKMSFNGLKKGITAVGSALKTVTSLAGKAAGALAKGVLAGVGAAGAGLAALGTSAIKNYSEYEQLAGGVETLFKDSSGQVMQYAQNAYKTAGMSTNAYMETVTSFSASLLQGLGGDTAKAASVADKAITDMSDNANKMGTDISSIQDAYQGFAKQNYTMLDNLKLGYGGTEAEMVRLINDSGVLGKKIKDMDGVSFDKIIEAIHVVQDDMGITGTTAKEAASTIQGSVSSMKAAWTNFLTGMADENADFDALAGALIDSVVTVGDNLIPRIKVLAPRLVEGFTKLAQSLAPELPGILNSVVPALVDGAIGLVDAFITAIQSNLPMLSEMAVNLLTKLAGFFLTAMPQLMLVGLQVIVTLISGMAQQLPTLIPLAINAIMMLANGLLMNLPTIIAAGVQVLMALANGIITMLPQLIPIGIQLIVQFIVGIMQALPQLLGMIPQIFFAFIEGLMAVDWLQVGTDVLKAIGDGILNGVKTIGSSIWNGVKGIFGGGDNKAEAQTSGVETMNSYTTGLTSGTSGITAATTAVDTSLVTGLTTDLTVPGMESMQTFNTSLAEGGVTSADTATGTAEGIKSTFDNLDLTSSGKNVMNGLISGMEAMRSAVLAKAQSIANAVATTINKALDINSPSGVAEWQMEMYGKGLVNGADNSLASVRAASGRLSGAMYTPRERVSGGSSSSETNNYSPQFTLNLSGTVDRTTERTVKKWIREALQDTFDGMGRTNPRLTEV